MELFTKHSQCPSVVVVEVFGQRLHPLEFLEKLSNDDSKQGVTWDGEHHARRSGKRAGNGNDHKNFEGMGVDPLGKHHGLREEVVHHLGCEVHAQRPSDGTPIHAARNHHQHAHQHAHDGADVRNEVEETSEQPEQPSIGDAEQREAQSDDAGDDEHLDDQPRKVSGEQMAGAGHDALDGIADLIVAVDRETLCEVTLTLGDVFESVDHRNQRSRDIVRNNPKENRHGTEDDNNEEYTTKLAALCGVRTNFAELLLDVCGKLFSELV